MGSSDLASVRLPVMRVNGRELGKEIVEVNSCVGKVGEWGLRCG
jgi:hypothetical protein